MKNKKKRVSKEEKKSGKDMLDSDCDEEINRSRSSGQNDTDKLPKLDLSDVEPGPFPLRGREE